jgi:hypothetical protein
MAIVVLKFEVADGNVSEFITCIRATALEFESAMRCPSLSPVGELRCETPKDHAGSHKNGTTSWYSEPVPGDEPQMGEIVAHRKSGARYIVDDHDPDFVWLVSRPTGSLRVKKDRGTFWSHYQRA